MTSPLRSFESEVLEIRPSRRVSFDCLVDGQRLLCVAIGEEAPPASALAVGQRILVRGRRSALSKQIFEAEVITPLTCRRDRATRPASFHPRA